MQDKLYQLIAGSIGAIRNMQAKPGSHNAFGARIHSEALDQFDALLPSGSGLDCGVKIDRQRSKADRLVFTFSFHHMNEVGMYDGWSEHELIITPSLQFGFEQRITGKDRNDIKEYLYDVFRWALSDEIESEVIGEGEDREIRYYSIAMRQAAQRYQEGIRNGSAV